MAITPWGTHAWLMPKIGPREWTTIACASFEDRCVGSAEIVGREGFNRFHAFRVSDPPNRFSAELQVQTDKNVAAMESALGGTPVVHALDLMTQPADIESVLKTIDARSIFLDITSLPKRYFLFVVKRLLARKELSDLVVCYTRPLKYREGPLSENANPLVALPGFSREMQTAVAPTVVIGVGYVSFDINDLMEQTGTGRLKALFPFPPGSPASRRNWKLLRKLIPDSSATFEIQRVNALDMFAALDYLRMVSDEASDVVDMVPLGPKPHALAMGLAAIDNEGAQLIYAQPKTYYPDYSTGVRRLEDGSPEAYTYCLRRSGIDFWRRPGVQSAPSGANDVGKQA